MTTLTTQFKNKVLGYGICGSNERYLEQTLNEFKRLCDHTVILCNKSDEDTIKLIASYGFDIVHDDREWGLNQHKIKEEFVVSLAKYEPEWLVCLDMDETFDPSFDRAKLEEYAEQCDSMYVYIVNKWNDGWKKAWSFWNIRVWKWNGITKFVNRPLHCGLAPEWAYHYGSYVPVILWHYGLKDQDIREKKIARYEKYDPNAIYRDRKYYDALKSNTSEPIDVEYIQDAINKECLPIRRHKIHDVNKIFYYVRTPQGTTIDIPEKSLSDTLKRPGFTLIGKIE